MPDINKIREEIDKNNSEMEKKRQQKIKEEYEGLSEQEKPTEELIKEKEEKTEKKEEMTEEKKKHSAAKAMEGKEEKKDLEKEITGNFYDELEKIKDMRCETKKQQSLKTKKCFELIEEWKNYGCSDNFKGVQKVFTELEKSETQPTMAYYWQKKESTKRIALAMASNYDQWNIPDKEKIKIINSFVKNKSKGKEVFYQKDKTLAEIAQILASKDIPYKDGVKLIIKNIDNPTEKQKTIEKLLKIEKKPLEENKKYLKEIKEILKKQEIPSEENVKEQLEEMNILVKMEKIIKDPKTLSKIISNAFEISKDADVQESWGELKSVIRKTIEKAKTPEKEEKEEVKNVVKNAKDFIKKETGKKGENGKEKKDSKWGTGFGVLGQGILLFLILFMLLELKGVDYLIGQTSGGGKKKQ